MRNILKGLEHRVKRMIPKPARKYLRSSRYELITTRARPIDLIVHVGAHFAEERAEYEAIGARTVLWIEADPDTFTRLEAVLAAHRGPARHIAHLGLVSETPGKELSFHRLNGDGASSSLYHATDTYKQRFQKSRETGESLSLRAQTLPQILAGHEINPKSAAKAMLVVDVQGHELAVLKGLGDGLCDFAFCKCEVSRVPMYAGGVRFGDLDAYIRAQGFRLVSHFYARVPHHGDVLYARRA